MTITSFNKRFFLSLMTLMLLSVSCRKFVEVGPPTTELTSDEIFATDATVTGAIAAIYNKMMDDGGDFGSYTVSVDGGLSADEFTNFSTSPDQVGLANNTMKQTNSAATQLWTAPYGLIYQANAIIAGLPNAPDISQPVKQQVLGEATFMRAFCHFYLVNFFGDVPYITTTDYTANGKAVRLATVQVYEDIIADLKVAQGLLKESYPTGERVRPNKWTATALLARAYLYKGDWADAEAQSTAVLQSGLYSLEPNLNNVFLNTSPEAIWQLIPVVGNGYNAWEALNLILTTAPSSVALSSRLLNAFEAGDQRKADWVSSIVAGGQTYYFPFKYNSATGTGGLPNEYSMVFRLGELYLIRAEARAQQKDIAHALPDIDSIRARAGLPLLENTNPGIGQQDLLLAIEHERQVELFTEWGHRWLDLKRTNRADAVLGTVKPSWTPTAALYPIPFAQLSTDPAMTQNPGYTH